jgi:hypothetical protein
LAEPATADELFRLGPSEASEVRRRLDDAVSDGQQRLAESAYQTDSVF